MGYYFGAFIESTFEGAIDKVTAELKKEGFGIITEIDVKKTLKEKMDVEFRKYRILGACNPSYAYKALLAENKIGAMLPCNVVVQEKENGVVEVSVVDPVASMLAVKNDVLQEIAKTIQGKLQKVIENL
ncbi:DUF302 domain-containing protein [Candidatus Moduliflexota bacterium]